MAKILIIDDEEQLRKLLARIIALEGYEVAEAADCAGGLRMLRRYEPDVVLCDVKLPDGNGVEMVERIKQAMPSAEVILLTAYGNIPDGVQAIKNGAFDYITKGDDNNKILPLLSRATEKAQMQRRLARLEDKLSEEHSFDRIIGSSESLRSAVALARKVAVTDTSVLLTGETGTGKEVFAQAIHHASPRAKGAFVAVNCSAFSKELLESELFGHRAGSFTGATKDKKGLFEEADKGTLFLDEIGEMPISLQSRLLRVLQEREVMPLGSESIIPVDVRVIAATNQNLADMVAKGEFRQDLYYRLNILRIHMPTLAERREDIPLLARSMMKKMQKLNPQLTVLTDAAADFLQQLPWPGNIRQLANMIERIMLLTDGTEIDRADIQAACEDDVEIRPFHRSSQAVPAAQLTEAAEHEEENGHVLQSVEEETMYRVLQEEGYNYSRAAKRLGIHRTTLWRKMKKYQHKSTTRD